MGIDPAIDITTEQRKTVLSLLEKHLPNTTVWVYGSRAKWTARPQSDLDMVVFTTPEQSSQVFALREAFEESNLPFRVDLFVWDDVPERFRERIEAEYVVLVEEGGNGEGSEWRKVPLDDVIDLVLSSVDKKTKDNERAVQLCNYTDVYYNSFIHASLGFMTATATDREIAKCSLFSGDVVITKDSEKHDDIGVPALVREDIPGLVCGYHLAILRPMPSKIEGNYLFYALCTSEVQHQFHSYANGITRFGLRKADIGLVEIPLPSLSEQRAIAHILGTLDDKIELNRRMNETLEEMARALFKSWFVDFDPVRAKMEGRDTGLPPDVADLFPDRLVESELGEIPKEWEVKALGECIDVARGLSYKGSGLSSDGMPMHNLNSIYEGGGYKDDGIKYYNGDYHLRHVIQPGEVIVANTEQGHDRLLIGFAAIVPKSFGDNGLFSHHIYRVRPKDSFALTPDFICQLLNTKAMHNTISGYSTGTTVNMLPVDALRIPSIVVPPLQVVTTFSTFAKVARIRQGKLMAESRTLTALRDALLPKLVSGELQIRGNVQKGSI